MQPNAPNFQKTGRENDDSPELSIVIPVMNEAHNVEPLAAEIDRAMQNYDGTWECIWVDDGSTDATLAAIKQLCSANRCHRFIAFGRNYGQSAALYAGWNQARGRILATLDGDGQNDPQDIPPLVSCLVEQGADMVNGWRRNRSDSIVRKISSRIANGFRNRLTRENVRDVGCSLRVFRKSCVDRIVYFKGMHRFLPTLVRLGGNRHIIERPVNHRPRQHGQTKYGIHNRLWVGLADTLAVCWMQRRVVWPEMDSSSVPVDGEDRPAGSNRSKC